MKLLLLALLAASAHANGKNIVRLAQSVPDLSTLVSALNADVTMAAFLQTGSRTTTPDSPGLTVFAPNNEAFGKLPAATLAHLLNPANVKELDDLLAYHILPNFVKSADLQAYQMVKTVNGEELQIVKAGRVVVQNATVVSADNIASNGVVHIIDGVLNPPTPSPNPNHLWFRFVNAGAIPDPKCPGTCNRCGEVDAASRMPASLFEPSHAAALALYTKLTLDTWGGEKVLELGRCKGVISKKGGTYTVPDGTAIADWTQGMFEMGIGKVCKEHCHCEFEGNEPRKNCHNQTTADPKNNNFCSLCGEFDNRPISITLFKCNLDHLCREGGNHL